MRSACVLFWGVATVPFLFAWILIAFLFAPSGKGATMAASWWARSLLAVGGVRVRVEGAEHLFADTPVLYISSHASNLDPWVLFPHLPGHVRMVSKQSLRWIPFFGWGVAAARFILIDRNNRERAIASLQRAAERIHKGISVLVFAEGTRSRDGRLQEFKKGGFHLAVAAKVPLIPLALLGVARSLPRGSVWVRPGQAVLRVGAPIVVTDQTPDELRQQAYQAVRALLDDGVDPTHPAQQAGPRAPEQS